MTKNDLTSPERAIIYTYKIRDITRSLKSRRRRRRMNGGKNRKKKLLKTSRLATGVEGRGVNVGRERKKEKENREKKEGTRLHIDLFSFFGGFFFPSPHRHPHVRGGGFLTTNRQQQRRYVEFPRTNCKPIARKTYTRNVNVLIFLPGYKTRGTFATYKYDGPAVRVSCATPLPLSLLPHQPWGAGWRFPHVAHTNHRCTAITLGAIDNENGTTITIARLKRANTVTGCWQNHDYEYGYIRNRRSSARVVLHYHRLRLNSTSIGKKGGPGTLQNRVSLFYRNTPSCAVQFEWPPISDRHPRGVHVQNGPDRPLKISNQTLLARSSRNRKRFLYARLDNLIFRSYRTGEF